MSRQRWILLDYPSFDRAAADDAPIIDRSCPIWVADADLVDACVYCGRSRADHDVTA